MLSDGQEILEGRFIIQKKLGSGAFGEIYKGKHRFLSVVLRAAWFQASEIRDCVQGSFNFHLFIIRVLTISFSSLNS